MVRGVRQVREERAREGDKARRWYEYGLVLTAFLQWHAAWVQRERGRESEAEMRRQMSEGQYGLSAVPSGLSATQDKLRHLLSHPPLLPLPRPVSPSPSPSSSSPSPMADAFDDSQSNGVALTTSTPSSSSSVDVPSLVTSVLLERNPTYSSLFFHVVVSVGTQQPSPHTDVLLHSLSQPQADVAADGDDGEEGADQRGLGSAIAEYTAREGRRSPPLHVLFRQHVGPAASTPYTGYQGAVFLLSSAVGIEDVPSLLVDVDADSVMLPPVSRFDSDRRRLQVIVDSLHRQSHLPLVILYPLSTSALHYLHTHGPSSSPTFQQQAAAVLAQALRLPSLDPRVVADVSLSPLFLPSHLFSSPLPPRAMFGGLNVQCIAAALVYLASTSPAYPVLHRVDVPMTVEARVEPCLTYLRAYVDLLISTILSLPPSPSPLPPLLSTFSPQLCIDHFNAALHSYTKRLFTRGLRDLSWPPSDVGVEVASPSSPSSVGVARVRRLLSALALPSFPAHAREGVVEWTWEKSYTSVVAYLASYRPLSAVTREEDEEGEGEGGVEAIGGDLYGLYHRAEVLFSGGRGRGRGEGSEGEEDGRVQRLRSWMEWMDSLLHHRLEELMMHPSMIEEDQHVTALIDTHTLTRHIDSSTHSHILPALPPSPLPPPLFHMPHINGHLPPPIQQTPAKRRKVDDAISTPQTQLAVQNIEVDGMKAAASAIGLGKKSTSSDALWGALDDERARQERLELVLSELEAEWRM